MPIIDSRASRSIILSSKSGSMFAPRKRAKIHLESLDVDAINFSSFNSGYLSGLFADVAKVAVLSELRIQPKRGPHLISPDVPEDSAAGQTNGSVDNGPMTKRSCLALNRSSIKARASCKNLDVLAGGTVSYEVPNPLATVSTESDSQLSDFSKDISSSPSQTGASFLDGTEEALPHLPNTVSDSSCGHEVSRAKLDHAQQEVPLSNEINSIGSFGWFVDLDEGEDKPGCVTFGDSSAVSSASGTDKLAFQQATPPKRVSDDADLEWAQAADTVDSVLGDLF